jgi:mono/diheme cytochrome c family protein
MMHTVFQPLNARTILAATLACWAVTVAMTPGVSARGAQKTANDGVYTAAQADRGEATFKEQCASCHAPADFTSDDFLKKWTGKPLHALYETVSETMPMDNPGTLKPQQYADVLGYFLKLNKFPAGQEELKSAADALKAISFAKKAGR